MSVVEEIISSFIKRRKEKKKEKREGDCSIPCTHYRLLFLAQFRAGTHRNNEERQISTGW
jgi:hypothetical protein